MINKRVWSISQLLAYTKNKLANDAYLVNVKVEGEIGNFKPNFSGHWYFTLKDSGAVISCAMFRNSNAKCTFMPKDGDLVTATGSMSVYEKSGQMQLIITSIDLSGAGNFYIQFEKMRQKLQPLGYFDVSRKKSIPKYPNKIAVVTGANTAALRDIQITIGNRWPNSKIIVCPAQVQGLEAPTSIIKALKQADSLNADVCILARGGGSVDDLWCFNDEGIAKAIFEMKTPIVTGIGHEIDTTIADLVADERCATPTAAAQRVTPNKMDVINKIDQSLAILKKITQQRLSMQQQNLDYFYTKLQTQSTIVQHQQRKLDLLNNMLENEMIKKSACYQNRYTNNLISFKDSAGLLTTNINTTIQHYCLDLQIAIKEKYSSCSKLYLKNIAEFKGAKNTALNKAREQNSYISNLNHQNELNVLNRLKMADNAFEKQIALLDSVSPLKVLARGYSITSQNDKVIRKVDDIDMNKNISIRLKDGTLHATPVAKEKNNG